MHSRQDAKDAKMDENSIGKEIVDAALAIHRELGPGLLETVYEVVLSDELRKRGLHTERQVPISIIYRGMRFDEGFRADMIIEDKVIIELKTVESLHNAHKKQLLTYLKLTGLRLGFLLNFGEAMMKDGIIRIVNGLPDGMTSLAVLASWREKNHVISPLRGGASIRRQKDEALDPAGGTG